MEQKPIHVVYKIELCRSSLARKTKTHSHVGYISLFIYKEAIKFMFGYLTSL